MQTLTTTQLAPAWAAIDACYTDDGNTLAGAETLLTDVIDELMAMDGDLSPQALRRASASMDDAVLALGDACMA